MDAIVAARELGKAIQQDERYLRVMQAQGKNDADAALQESINAFNVLRNQINAEVQKEAKDTEKIKAMDAEIKELYGAIFQNENMAEFTKARNEMQGMLDFINQIINGSVEGQNPEQIEFREDCGGSCSSCSGCS